MPWDIFGDYPACPASEPWAVVKRADKHVEGCHATEDEAKRQQAALYANEGSMNSSHENGTARADFTADEIAKMVANGQAMPNGSYPIPDEEHLRKAIKAVGRGGASHNAIRRHIMKRAKALGLSDLIPDNWAADGSLTGGSAARPMPNIEVRAVAGPDVATIGEGRTLYGHFSVFDTWARISSQWEGTFMERVAPTAFDRTISERGSQVKVLYEHGKDPELGNKPLGPLTTLRTDKIGGYYEVDLIDTTYNNGFIIPAARAGLLGASFRFSIPEGGDTWNEPTRATPHNPDMLPERTITDVELYELGPVTWGAYPQATAAVRSGTDDFLDHFLNDPLFVARFRERVGPAVVDQIRAELPTVDGDETPDEAPTERDGEQQPVTADGGEADSKERRERWLQGQLAGFHASLARLESRSNE